MQGKKEPQRGNIRKVDDLGRLVIPMDIRRRLNITKDDPLEILATDKEIIVKKYEEACVFCGKKSDLVEFKDKIICSKCLSEIKESK